MPMNSGREPEVRIAGGQERCERCRRPVGPSGLCKPCDQAWAAFWEGKSPGRKEVAAAAIATPSAPITLASPSKAVRALAAAIREVKPAASPVRERRKALGWPQVRLAKEAGVSLRTVRDLEAGRSVGERSRKKIADALDGKAAEAA